MKLQLFVVVAVLLALGSEEVLSQHNPNYVAGRTTMVHLFEWKWTDIAQECERFLAPYGFAGVQVSPPNENVVVNTPMMKRPWHERYQPVSYKLETRSGTEAEFSDMVQRCNAVGVRIYVDAVINHMTGDWPFGTVGTNGSSFSSLLNSYPSVPYSQLDFNGRLTCPTLDGNIKDYSNPQQVRNCKLLGLRDLNQALPHVQQKIVEFLNKMTVMGVAGYRFDASKHMHPENLKLIVNKLNDLPTSAGFPAGTKPFIFQEVIDLGGEPITASEYTQNGQVTEFKYGKFLGEVFRKQNNQLRWLKNFGTGWGMLNNSNALVFVDNHDNQRGHGAGGPSILTFRDSRLYKMAVAFMLAWPYGTARVMSSYYWERNMVNGKDLNDWIGPPHDNLYRTLPVPVYSNMTCGNGWICEHRWRQIYNMVKFRNNADGVETTNWWDNEKDSIAFARPGKGFIFINNDDFAVENTFQTTLAPGSYCDIISGNVENGKCSGKTIIVDDKGTTNIRISNTDEDPMVAISSEAKL